MELYCTGCELCIAVCPVDCISLENVTGERTGWNAWSQQEADVARNRYEFHSLLHPNLIGDSSKLVKNDAADILPIEATGVHKMASTKRAVIEAAMAKARSSRAPIGPVKL